MPVMDLLYKGTDRGDSRHSCHRISLLDLRHRHHHQIVVVVDVVGVVVGAVVVVVVVVVQGVFSQ